MMTDKTEPAGNGQSKKSSLVEAFTAPVTDGLRQDAMRHLVDYLESGTSLVARCEDLVVTQPNDKLGTIYAVARLMQANARVAEALSRFAPAEQRRRSVVLHLQDDRPTREELVREIEAEKAQSGEDVVAQLERRLALILEREQAAKKLWATPPPPSVTRHRPVEHQPIGRQADESEPPDDES